MSIVIPLDIAMVIPLDIAMDMVEAGVVKSIEIVLVDKAVSVDWALTNANAIATKVNFPCMLIVRIESGVSKRSMGQLGLHIEKIWKRDVRAEHPIGTLGTATYKERDW